MKEEEDATEETTPSALPLYAGMSREQVRTTTGMLPGISCSFCECVAYYSQKKRYKLVSYLEGTSEIDLCCRAALQHA